MDLISRQVLDIWNRYKSTIAVDAIEYDMELRKLLGTNLAEVGTDCISKSAAIDAYGDWYVEEGTEEGFIGTVKQLLEGLPSAQPEIIRCKDCKYWHSGSCEYPEHAVNSQDYMVGDMETEAEHFCGYAERREVTE